ncbi:uncharacterized protein SAMN02745111_01543 [Eubacterium uniforme]|uniref:HD domain-containing protein n=1 Tax=Eubacterium uniforme TaxID=39495 RepID=A0A1T4VUI9_9FIRM|nr:HD domain-containing protein [Eubacterium uniforme]SKA68161.1 uncharacterized protein SAMN02745111_01543 [Eubacterium uniforme]
MKKYEKEIEEILDEIKYNERTLDMKNFIQHGKISTYDHCESVTNLSYKINKKLHLRANEDTLCKGAMLHDFYLYDWHNYDDGSHKLHGFSHPKKASVNAKKYFEVSREVEHVISSHMWPLTFRSFPKSREAWIVCIADKCVAIRETLFAR